MEHEKIFSTRDGTSELCYDKNHENYYPINKSCAEKFLVVITI